MTICGHQCIDLVLNSLDTIFNLFTRTFPRYFTSLFHIRLHAINLNLLFNNIIEDFFIRFTYKWCQNTVNTINTLTTILTRCYLCNDLCCYSTSNLERLRCIDFFTIDYCAICKHIFQINQATVKHRLNNIIHIMEVDSSTIMGFQNIGRNQFTTSNILRYFTSN